MGRYALQVKSFLLGVAASCLLTVNVVAQGPFSAQIQQFYQFLQTGMNPPDGASVTIAGAAQAEYNGTYTITRIDADSFSYTFAGSATTPATGTITAQGGTVRPVRLIGDDLRAAALTTTGAASGKTVVCVDTSTGKLYASTSGVACAN